VKLQSLTKTKRIRDVPSSFNALKQTVEAQIKDERDHNQMIIADPNIRDYTIKYVDGDQEQINVSDDEDLITAYEVAVKELNGNLKFIIELKKLQVQSVPPQQTITETVNTKKEKTEPKESKDKKKKEKKEKKEAEKLLKKQEKEAKKATKKTKICGFSASLEEEKVPLMDVCKSRADTLHQP